MQLFRVESTQNEGLQGLQPRAHGSKLDYFHAGITSTRLHRTQPGLSPVPERTDKQSMRTGPDQGQIGPLLRRGFFCRERFARIFLSCPTPFLSGRISLQPITKLPSFLLKYFAVVLNCLPNEWILRGEAPGYWLRPVLSTRGEQLIPADDRKEETTLPYSFSP